MKWIFTFMLVAIIALGVYISGYNVTGESSVQDGEGCAYAELGLNAINPTCYEEGVVYFNVDNTGSVVMSGLKIYLEASYNMSITIDGQANPGAPIKKRLAFGNQGIKDFKAITLRPMIKQNGANVVCKDQKLRIPLYEC